MRKRWTISGVSAALAIILITACHAEPAMTPESEPAAETQEAVAEDSGFASAPAEYLPPLGDGGKLPRTLHGYTLLDAAPSGSEHEAGFPFEGAVFAYEVLRKDPEASVRAYSVDGKIFRIEAYDDGAPPMAELRTTALERYGKPLKQDENEVIWTTTESTLTLTHLPRSGATSIAIEDTDAALAAYRK
ncbi:MAG TPA: hypothetical protein VM534_04935 [Thermoanaerobaculia bacterium]|nr:hypothetical protein [Thermoanaerobaculia bacterium]